VIPRPQRIEAGVVDPDHSVAEGGPRRVRVFSYSHEDKHLARALAERLE
jgi:hypothetical protein